MAFWPLSRFLGDDRGKAAEHVVECVHHDALGAHAGAGHPSRRYPYPYVPTNLHKHELSNPTPNFLAF
jgi:hypothetical protein